MIKYLNNFGQSLVDQSNGLFVNLCVIKLYSICNKYKIVSLAYVGGPLLSKHTVHAGCRRYGGSPIEAAATTSIVHSSGMPEPTQQQQAAVN